MKTEELVFKAEFNPKIKTYYFVLISLIALIIPFIGWGFLLLWLLGLGQYITNRVFKAYHCQLNRRTLQFKKGIWITVEKTIPLENIQDLTFKEGPILRFFGLSVLEIETAGGQGNRMGSDLTLIGIIEAKAFREMVLEQRQKMSSKETVATLSTGHTDDQTQLLKDIAATLKSIESKLDQTR